jgi:hypothetical protein
MLSVHTQVENLVNLLHARRAEGGRPGDRHHAYERLVATILDVPIAALEDATYRQPALQPVTAEVSFERRRRAA